VEERELDDAREAAEAPLVRDGDEAVAGGQGGRLAPQGRELDAVDAPAPGVVGDEPRLEVPLGELLLEEPAAGERPELAQLRLDGAGGRRRAR
jgi:hypothetical protein